MLFAPAIAVVLVVTALAFAARDKERVARCLLWVGAAAPFLVTTPKSAASAGNVGPLDVVRGIVPFYCLVLSYALVSRRGRLGFGVAEFGLSAYLGVALLSTAWSVDARSTFLKAIVLIAVYACIRRLVSIHRSASEVYTAAAGISYLIVMSTVVNLGLFPHEVHARTADDPGRLHSIFPQIGSNVLAWVAGFAITALILNIGPAWALVTWRRVGLGLLATGEALATRTRLAIVVWVIAIVLILVIRSLRRTTALVVAIGFGAVVLCYFLINRDAVVSYVQRGQSSAALSSLTGRLNIWGTAEAVWRERPWDGFGFYSGHRFALLLANVRAADHSNIDNTWLESLVDVGIVGMVGLAIFALAALVRAIKMSSLPLDQRLFGVATCYAVIAVSFVNPSLQTPIMTSLLGATIMLGAAPPRRQRPAQITVAQPEQKEYAASQ